MRFSRLIPLFSLAFFSGFFPAISFAQGVAFTAATNFGAGVRPRFVAVGDFNGDGRQDLAVANQLSANVSILLGNGNGTFGGATNFGVGFTPFAVAVGDFNGDGRQDLAVANQGSATVSILLGNGDGTFDAAMNFGAGSAPSSVSVGDFNGDGRQDLAVANQGSANVSILLGNGNGTFGAATNFGVGFAPLSVAVGDFNGDGRQDLAVVNQGSATVSVLLGNGNGTFGAATNFAAATGPLSVAVGDFNRDGKQDLAVANQFSDNVSILLNGTAFVVGGPLFAAVLPSSRSVQVKTPATVFATVINTGQAIARGCSIAPLTSVPASFGFQTTNTATNQVTGFPNATVDIAAGAAQSFVLALTPTAPFPPTEVQFSFNCANSDPAQINVGLNTLLLSASLTSVPDIVALEATSTNDGIVNIGGTNGTGAFAVATVNLGASGSITASADTGAATLPVNISLCQTDPANGQCISGIGPSVTTQINANATPTFGIFVQGNGTVPFDPAANRVFVRFKDTGGVIRGSTSVAVRTQ
jgi:FG-GAP-like repeat/FG-GAP repeat